MIHCSRLNLWRWHMPKRGVPARASAVPDNGNPEARFHHVLVEQRQAVIGLIDTLRPLVEKGRPIKIKYYDGRIDEGRLRTMTVSGRDILLILRDCTRRERGSQKKRQVKDPDPIIFCPEHAEWHRTGPRLDICLSAEDRGEEYGFSLFIDLG